MLESQAWSNTQHYTDNFEAIIEITVWGKYGKQETHFCNHINLCL